MKIDTSRGYLFEISQDEIKQIEYIHGTEPTESIQDAYERTGCDIIINSNFYNMSTGEPVGTVIDEGKFLSSNGGFGYAFVNKKTPTYCWNNKVGAVDFIGAYPNLVKDRAIYIDSNDTGFSATSTSSMYKRGRTAIGLKPDGTFVIYCLPDNMGSQRMTIPELAEFMLSIGCVNAGNMDGGDSSQIYTSWFKYKSGRKVDGFIAVWLNKDTEKKYFRCQLGAYSTRANAEKAVKQAKAKGLDAMVKYC